MYDVIVTPAAVQKYLLTSYINTCISHVCLSVQLVAHCIIGCIMCWLVRVVSHDIC